MAWPLASVVTTDDDRGGLTTWTGGSCCRLTRAVFFHERGEIRDGSFESQAFRASGLNIVVSAIILWNTIYLSRAVETLRAEGNDLPDHIIRHVSPRIWEHINLTGIYAWRGEAQQEGPSARCAHPKRNYVVPPEEGGTMEPMITVCSLIPDTYALLLS